MVAPRIENNTQTERFIKIPRNNTKELLEPFQRQIIAGKYIEKHNIIATRKIISAHTNKKTGVPFLIQETFPVHHDKIGFIENGRGVKKLGKREAQSIISQLMDLQSIPVQILPARFKKVLKSYKGGYKRLRASIIKHLNRKVTPVDYQGKEIVFWKLLDKRFRTNNVMGKVLEILEQFAPHVAARRSDKPVLVHGDFAPNNLYVYDSGKVEFLDLE